MGHPRQFLPKLRKNVQASVHRRKLLTRDLVGRRTIFGGRFDQSHQVRDVIETELPCMAQEGQPFERSVIVTSLTAVCALGRWDQTPAFLVVDRRHLHAGPARHLPD